MLQFLLHIILLQAFSYYVLFVITLIPETMDLLCAGHFLLTYLLLDNMKNASRTVEGRIVNLSSEGHRFAPSEGIRFDKINDQSTYVATTCSFLY